MKTPNTDALRFAAEWLRQYDDTHDGGEQTSVAAAVADWLDEQADAKELRAAAAEHGVPVAKIRKLLSVRSDVAEIPGVLEQKAG